MTSTAPPATPTLAPSSTATPLPPSATAAPSLAPTLAASTAGGEVAELFNGATALGAHRGRRRQLISVPAGESRYLAVTYLRHQPGGSSVTTDGHVYLGGGSRAQIGLVNETEFQLEVLPGSDVFAQTGPYSQGHGSGGGRQRAGGGGQGLPGAALHQRQ